MRRGWPIADSACNVFGSLGTRHAADGRHACSDGARGDNHDRVALAPQAGDLAAELGDRGGVDATVGSRSTELVPIFATTIIALNAPTHR